MKILINIPKEVKKRIDSNLNACDLDTYDCVMLATLTGIPINSVIKDIKAKVTDYFQLADVSSTDQKAILEIIDRYMDGKEN